MTRKTIGMRALLGLALLGAQACALPWDEPEELGSYEQHASVPYGNAAALPGNAAALPGNAAALPGNAAALPGNAAALPGNAATIAAGEANAVMVKPRRPFPSKCGVYKLSDWEFAASYRCGLTGRIHTSDITVDGVNLGNNLCSQCGASTPRRVYLPATLSNLTQTWTRDAVLEIDFAGPSEYECTKHDYAVMTYRLRISTDNCQSFSNPDLVTAFPAPQRLFAGTNSLVPRGEGWGLIVPANTSSAAFKSAHYTKMILTFYPERYDAWRYNYRTSTASCSAQPSSCLSGASLLLGYSLALANLAPVQVNGTVYGIPGTVTGVPTWLSLITPTGILDKPDIEVGTQRIPNDYVKPGSTELARNPYTYDAVFAPGAHYHSSARNAYGSDQRRVDRAREKFCHSTTACQDTTVHNALFANYNAGRTSSPAGADLTISNLYAELGANAPFIATAMPAPGATASCSTETERRRKQPVEVTTGPSFCIPLPPPPIGGGSGTGTGTGTGSGSGSGS